MGLFVFLFAVCFTAAFLQSGIGFGAAVIMINLIPFLLAPAKAIVISQSTCMFLNVFMLMKYRKHIRWDVFLAMVFPALLAAGICTKVSLGFDVSLMKMLLGFLFIFFSIWFSFFADRIKLKPTKGLAFTAGTISGAMNGFFGAGGPPAILYLAPALEKKEAYLATAQLFFLSSNIMSFITRVLFGSVETGDLPGIGVGVIGMFLGFHIGTKVTKRLNGVLLRRFVYIFIGINGLVIVLKQLL